MTPFSLPQQTSGFSSATNGPAATAPSSSFRIGGAVGKAEDARVQRGDLTGEDCLTLVFDGKRKDSGGADSTTVIAVWLEDESNCVVREMKVASRELDKELLLEIKDKMCVQSPKREEGKKKGKKSKVKQTVTLVLPTTGTQVDVKAAQKLATEAGCALKNVFSRSVAEVAGLLSLELDHTADTKSGSLLAQRLLLADKDDDHICMHVRREADGNLSGAVVACEGSKVAKKRGNLLGLSRMVNKKVVRAAAGAAAADVLLELQEYCIASCDGVAACCVILSGEVVASAFTEKQKSSLHFYSAGDRDAVRGGCVLSAAELESSKQYINHEQDGWVLAYQLPVADSFLTEEIGLFEVASASQTPTHVAEPLFAPRQRLWKQEQGSIRVGSQLLSLSVSRQYKYGSPYSTRNDGGSYPRLQLARRSASGDSWEPLGDPFSPLRDPASQQAHSSCTVNISMDPHSGSSNVAITRGDSVLDVKARHYFWLQVAAFFAGIVGLVGMYFAYARWSQAWEVHSHRQWLLDFYRANAPDKLKDGALIEKTLVKYKDKMFVLWRTLERTYNVKIKKPYGIVDDL